MVSVTNTSRSKIEIFLEHLKIIMKKKEKDKKIIKSIENI